MGGKERIHVGKIGVDNYEKQTRNNAKEFGKFKDKEEPGHLPFSEINSVDSLKEEITKREAQIVLIYGLTASGKSEISKKLTESLYKIGYSVPTINEEPHPIPLDMFYRDGTYEKAKKLGLNFDHPFFIAHKEASKKIKDLINKSETKIPIYSFSEGKRIGSQEVRMSEGKRKIIIAEGIYAFALRPYVEGDYNTSLVYVTTQSSLELVARRIIRDLRRVGNRAPEDIIKYTVLAIPTNTMYMNSVEPDMKYVNNWSVLESIGTKSYQVKISFEDAKRLISGKPSEVQYFEDLIIRDEKDKNKQLRLRIYWNVRTKKATSAEFSYRKKEGEITTQWEIKGNASLYSLFINLATLIANKTPERYPKELNSLRICEIHELDENTRIKLYVEANIAEIESQDPEKILKIITEKGLCTSYNPDSYYNL